MVNKALTGSAIGRHTVDEAGDGDKPASLVLVEGTGRGSVCDCVSAKQVETVEWRRAPATGAATTTETRRARARA